jgi:capsular exopolysaccharide synthesis family protein
MDDSTAVQSTPPRVLVAIARRWWLMLLLIATGASVGFLLYSTRPAVYRSDAKLRVLKRDAARDAASGRIGYVDDYVNSQQETIQSEYILGPAATSPIIRQASLPFQERLTSDPITAYDTLRNGLAVTRGKDTYAGLANSLILLSYTAADPRDARIALEAVIDTFKRDLRTKSDDTVKDAIKKLQTELDALDVSLTEEMQRKGKSIIARYDLTPQEPQSLVADWTAGKNELASINRQLAEVSATLDLLKTAKTDRRDRLRLAELITATRLTSTDSSATTLEGQKRMMDQNIQRLAETLGKDHPTMKEEVAKRDFLGAEIARLNPDNPGGETDDLVLLQAQFERKRITLTKNRDELDREVDRVQKLLKDIRPYQVDIEQADFTINKLREQKSIKTAELARLIANQKTTDEIGGIEATVLNQPRDGTRVGPVLITWVMPGAMLGGLLAGGLATLFELRDRRFRSPAEVRQRLGLPVVGHLPALRLNKPAEADAPAGFDPTLVAAVRPKSAEAEAFRGLRTQVLKSAETNGSKVIQVTSPCPSDGKSTLAANLAVSLAQAGKSVVIIDADFRKPRVHELFGLSSTEPGMAAAAERTADVLAVVRPTSVEHLSVIPCGPRPDTPAELLSSQGFLDALMALKERFDFVVVDTPPLLAVSDPRVVAQRVDAVLLTLRLTKSTRSEGERAAEMLTDLGVSVLGVAVNSTREQEGYGYGGYRYRYEADGYTG